MPDPDPASPAFIKERRYRSCFVHCMAQSRQITDPDNRFGITAFTTLAQASLINKAPPRLKLRSVNLGVVDSLVPRFICWRKRPACAPCYKIKISNIDNSIGSPDSRINAQSLRCCFLLFLKSSLGIFWLLRQSPDCVRVQT